MSDTKNILVTGGAGYIGSHTCKILAKAGYTPITYDNLVYGHRWAVNWGPLEVGDIADRDRLNEVIRTYQPEGVVHFAAYAYVSESVEKPAKYYRNNVAGTLTLLETMHNNGINKIVFSSSCATYGIPVKVPIPEDHPQSPINPYGASKLMVERILEDFNKAYGICFFSLRYFNAAGADPAGEIGESHDPETHLIPLILDVAIGTRPNISVYGNDYETPDGTCIRDYIHVTDLADAHVRALDYLESNHDPQILNLGTGKGYSVKEVISAAESIVGAKIPTVISGRRSGDPPVLVAVADKAKQLLKWKPKYSDLETIIRTAWNWHKMQKIKENSKLEHRE